MPPFGYRKRERSSSPAPDATPKSRASKKHKSSPAKPTLFETADAPTKNGKSVADNKQFLDTLHNDSDEDSSLSEADTDDFEDVPPAKRRKTSPTTKNGTNGASKKDGGVGGEDDDDDDDEMDWEDAIQHTATTSTVTPNGKNDDDEIADVSISMNEDGSYIEPLVSAATIKKGPSKRERQIRVTSHCLHVQTLMWHNTVRNAWLNDTELQEILRDGLPEGVKKEIECWRGAMGMLSREELDAKKREASNAKRRGRKGGKDASKGRGRDWTYDAGHAEPGAVDMSGGDPLLRLLRVLTAYWRKRFVATARGVRKQGYMPLRRLRDEVKHWEKDHHDMSECGERIESREQLRKCARRCEGSRDVGAQLFVALLRAIGLETRMVANLQPVGFGWSKAEDADAKKAKPANETSKVESTQLQSQTEEDDDVELVQSNPRMNRKSKPKPSAEKSTRKSTRGDQKQPISLDTSDSGLSSPPSDLDEAASEQSDDESLIDVTPATPKRKSTKKFDRDLAFPNYWTEVCSPATHKYYPVDPIVLSTIASNDELLQTFEPRGKKAEKSKQVICYTIGFSADGTAKDVTVRYLKKHQLPGKTKGVRMPVEKMPIYNHKGKVKRYEDYDWFRTIISMWDRPENKRTTADDLEDQTDLKPFKPVKEAKEVEKESLQWYKQSAEYALEQHLRREEALRPGAEPVKTFTAGKSDKAQEHPVYLRSDVLNCKTVESWHKEGRAIKVGEQPIKYVPMRAVTLVRKREMEDAQRETGEKLKQGLYSRDQTDWIIPPPIQDGIIPKNAFGNMDVYVPTMVPEGAVHLPLKGSAKLCKRLGIDFAEACTGFEFGKQRAVPVLTGVVVAEENQHLVRDAWRAEQAEQKRKSDTKRTAAALKWWRKMLLGLRVLDRMRVEYAERGEGADEEINPFIAKAKREGRDGPTDVKDETYDEDESGGFFRPGEENAQERQSYQNGGDARAEAAAGGFLVEEDPNAEGNGGGGFLLEQDDDQQDHKAKDNPITPVSLQSLHNGTDDTVGEDTQSGAPTRTSAKRRSSGKRNAAGSTKAASRKKAKVISDDEGEESSLTSLSEEEAPETTAAELDSASEVSQSSSGKSRNKAPSPRVIITPGSARRTSKRQKSTPLKSKYFSHDPPSNEDQPDDDSNAESETEVVKPRRTTARTRSKKT